LKLPRTYQWSLSLQQSLGTNQSVSATYLGSAGRDLLLCEFLTPPMGLSPNFDEVWVVTNDAYSNYDALQLQYQRHLSRGLQVLASYGWARALDNASLADETLATPYRTFYNPNRDYGNADFDVRHSFSAAISYSIPSPKASWLPRAIAGNWAVDSLFRGNTALPFTVVTGLDPLGLNEYGGPEYARADVVPNQPFWLYGSQYPGGKALNPNAFQIPTPPPGSVWVQGDLGRNALRGFDAWEEDLAIRREFPIHESLRLQFRADFFNIFNHPNFGDPGKFGTLTNAIGSPQFGLSTMTLAQSLYPGAGNNGFSPLYQIGGPRSVQLSLKLVF
jgi:hypothetical protein